MFILHKILVTGALGQIGSELVVKLREVYGKDNVIASNRRIKAEHMRLIESGPFEIMDINDIKSMADVVDKYQVDSIINLASILSAKGEKNPLTCWHINMDGLINVLEVAREKDLKIFNPSSIAAFGPSTPPDNTPQNTIQRPTTIYGITKLAGELLCDYYFNRYGVDTRGVRFPGLISYETLPGGGTTDYAVHIFYEAIRYKRYTSYIAKGTKMDMMYMPDALDALIKLMEADPTRLKHRNAYNLSSMSFEPGEIAASIRKHIPDFILDYDVDPVRQAIAESWPNSMDDSVAREEWDWNTRYDLDTMVSDMIDKLRTKGFRNTIDED